MPGGAKHPSPAPRTGSPVLATVLIVLAATAGCGRSGTDPGRWRDTALAGLRWIEGYAVTGPDGAHYPDVPADSIRILDNPDLYHGQAGRAFGFLQAAVATGDEAWRTRALDALRSLQALTRASLAAGVPDAGLYSGLSGPGAALLAGARFFPEQTWLREGGLALADTVCELAHRGAVGATWSGVPDIISGTAGTGLFLLEAWRVSSESRYLDAAREAGDWLLGTVRRAGGTLFWPIGGTAGRHYPNFAHGTAGVCFFLGELAAALGSGAENYLAARRAGLAWLAVHGDADGCVVFHHEGDGEDLQYVSWCHGPAGTSRAFLQETGLPGAPAAAGIPAPAREGGDWLITAVGAEPGVSPSGYWNNVSVCCGTAGILIAMLDLYLASGEERYLEHARACARVLRSWAVPDGAGLSWPQAEHRVRPEFIQAQTGYMQGAAGIAAALLRLWLVETGRPELIVRLPDEVRIEAGR